MFNPNLKNCNPTFSVTWNSLDRVGSLVVARLEVRQTDAGPFRKLVSDRVDYVGVGATPADAELSRTPGRSGSIHSMLCRKARK